MVVAEVILNSKYARSEHHGHVAEVILSEKYVTSEH
jgi:hypothetical protein